MNRDDQTVLYASRSEIEKHWGLLQAQLGGIFPKAGGKYWIEGTSLSGINGDLLCSVYINEKALRERGAGVSVVPLLFARERTARYWVSLHQSWSEPSTRQRERFLYHTTAITIFCGQEYDEDKLQLFRAEWPGLREMGDGSAEFEAPGAGHPHWQFDAYQHHLRERRKQQQRHDALAEVLREVQPEVEEFADDVIPDLPPEDDSALATQMQRLTRVHFASSTRWAVQPWKGEMSKVHAHAQAPANLEQILNWIISTLSYIQQEASR